MDFLQHQAAILILHGARDLLSDLRPADLGRCPSSSVCTAFPCKPIAEQRRDIAENPCALPDLVGYRTKPCHSDLASFVAQGVWSIGGQIQTVGSVEELKSAAPPSDMDAGIMDNLERRKMQLLQANGGGDIVE